MAAASSVSTLRRPFWATDSTARRKIGTAAPASSQVASDDPNSTSAATAAVDRQKYGHAVPSSASSAVGSLAARRASGSPSISPTTTSGFRRVASKPTMTLWQAALHRTSSTPGCARRNPSSASPCRSSTPGGSTRSRARPGMAWTRRARTTDGSPALIGPASVTRRVDSIGASLAPAAGSASPSLKRPSLHPLGRIGWLFARSHLYRGEAYFTL